MLKKLLNIIGKTIGLKSSKDSADKKKGPVQSKTGPGVKQHKKKIVSNYPDTRREKPEGQSPRYKGQNAKPYGKNKPGENRPKQSGGNKTTDQQKQKPVQGQKQHPLHKAEQQQKNKQQSKPVQHKKQEVTEKPVEKAPKKIVHSEEDIERHRKSREQRERIKPPVIKAKNIVSNKGDEEIQSMGSETAEDSVNAIRTPDNEEPIVDLSSDVFPDIITETPEPKVHSEKKQIVYQSNISEEDRIADENWDSSTFVVPELEGKIRFQEFDIPKSLLHAIADLNFQYCTPIQQEILSKSLLGKDAVGQAQTGTGKTAAFLITILSRLTKEPINADRKPGTPRALILAPTRELVMQIYKDALGFSKYLNINVQAVFGGMDYAKQRKQLHAKPVDIIIATPGRLIDFYDRRELHLSKTEILVIDEADRMLDMGFIPDVKKIVRGTPMKDKRQTLFFSATIDTDVMNLSQSWTTDSLNVKIEPDEMIVKNIEQIIYITTSDKKYPLLYNMITKKNLDKVMVFTNRRDEAKELVQKLYANEIEADVLSGDVLQRKRVKTLEDFRNGVIKVLVATDVAGRGIHIENISHVINYTLPEDPEDYVHRVGRTGRAGANGISISFATEDDSFNIPAIENYIGKKLVYSYPEEDYMMEPPAPTREPKQIIAAENAPLRKKKFSGKPYHKRGPRKS